MNPSSNLLVLTKRGPLSTTLDMLNETDLVSIINKSTNKKVIIQKRMGTTAYRNANYYML